MQTLALCLLALVLYTYAGYPVLAALFARTAPRPPSPRAGFEPSVSVCLSVHNGARFVRQKLASLRALDYPPDKLEFLLYSDGSSDETVRLARQEAARDPRLVVLESPTRMGKPSGLNRLRQAARGEVLLMTDVRQPLAPGALRALLEPLSDPQIGCVSGNLVLTGNTGAGAYWRYERCIRGWESQRGAMVGVSGSLYAIRRRDLVALPRDLLLDDMFVPLSTVARHKRVVLSARAEAYDQACDDERELARKVRTLAGNYQLFAKLPWLLLPLRNPLWFQLVSHKLLRLLCPFALAGLLLTSLELSLAAEAAGGLRAFWTLALAGQLSFYALAAAGGHAGRLGKLARTFVVLNVAAVLGLYRFVTGTQKVAW